MNYRELGRTGWRISEIGLGTWAIGGDKWGKTDDASSIAALNAAIDAGVNFFDTADVYGSGRSEQLIGQVLRQRREEIIVATKAGRGQRPHTASCYSKENLTRFVEASLGNLGTEAIDLLQLHCPPSAVYADPAVYAALDDLHKAGKIRFYGVSVERISEALAAIEHPGVQTVQVVFNAFRRKPIDELFAKTAARGVGVLARVPLASGLLAGKLSAKTDFAATDHRRTNRAGEFFDKGETFSGVDFDRGLAAVEELRALVPDGLALAQLALRWILMFPAVSAAIPGAKTTEQARSNAGAADLAPLGQDVMAAIESIYERYFRDDVHAHW